MSGFDDTCDKSAPGVLVDAAAIWDAVREVAQNIPSRVHEQDATMAWSVAHDPKSFEPMDALPSWSERAGWCAYEDALPPAAPDGVHGPSWLRGRDRAAVKPMVDMMPPHGELLLSATANTRLPDGRMLDDVLAENERLRNLWYLPFSVCAMPTTSCTLADCNVKLRLAENERLAKLLRRDAVV